MDLEIAAKINLDEINAGTDWDETIASLIRDEIRDLIKSEIRRQVKDSPKFKAGLKKLIDYIVEKTINNKELVAPEPKDS